MIDLVLRRAKDVVVQADLERLLSTKKLRIKHGIDPTGPRLHLGRASTLHRLRNLQDMGHTIVLIVGDFTAKIGDASDKASERQPLSDTEIKANMTDYERQLALVLDMNQVELHYNSAWLSKLTSNELIELAQQFTVAQMIERENYAIRFKENRPIGLHEFLYPILQGYDSVAVEADVEVGGTDQLFNLMAGRTLQKHYNQPPQQVMTFDLLTGPDGRKMSTSWGNAIYITAEPNDLYGQIMRINDELIAQYYRVCTDIEENVIQTAVLDIAAGANPRDTKASLAREIVRLYHGDDVALAAEDAFNKQFRDKQLPDDIKEQHVTKATWEPIELLVALKLADTNSAARRLIEQGGVRINDEKVDGTSMQVKSGDIIQVGKRRFVRLTVR
ncbi:MAG TPA: tyrosine--tRNA ligase [Candidatus Saccharimonadia bacterium]